MGNHLGFLKIAFFIFSSLLFVDCTPYKTTSSTDSEEESVSILWEEEDQIREETTSSCTIIDGEVYRMYIGTRDHGMVKTWTSSDGLTWDEDELESTGIEHGDETNPERHTVRNPAVIKLSEENYIMIFEGNTDAEEGELSGDPSLFRATSTDGVTFSDIVQVLTPDEDENNWMSVADLVEFDSKLYLYYVADFTKVFYATSEDDGETWTKGGEISISGSGIDTSTDKIVDPDVIVNPDGTLTLFFAYALEGELHFGTKGIYSADSSDGVTFTANGQVISTEEDEAKLDPDVIELIDNEGHYRMYFGYKSDTSDNDADFNLYSATSP